MVFYLKGSFLVSKTFNIGYVEPVGGHGGMNYYNSGLCNALSELDCSVCLYTSSETKESCTDKFEVYRSFVGIYGRASKYLRAFRYLKGLLAALWSIRKRGAAFCHLHFFHYTYLELVTCVLARLFGLKIVVTVHDVESFSARSGVSLVGVIFRLVDQLIVHNEFSKREVLKLLGGLGLSREISVIAHGNYLPYVGPVGRDEACSKLGLPPEKKVILFFGQIKKVKGLEVLIAAMPQILESHPEAVLLIAGKVWKDSFDEYSELISSLGLQDFVIPHIRYIDDSMVDYYYSAADLVVLPYRRIYQSGVLLMAMSYGAATLSSRLEPMQEVVDDGVDGFLFEMGDSADLAAVASKALDGSVKLVGVQAVEKMKRAHDWKVIAQQHLEVYKKYAR